MKSCDVEEIIFGDSGEDVRDSPDDFEDLQMDNDEDEVYLSDRCPCKCHLDTKKRTHCFSCCLKVCSASLTLSRQRSSSLMVLSFSSLFSCYNET